MYGPKEKKNCIASKAKAIGQKIPKAFYPQKVNKLG